MKITMPTVDYRINPVVNIIDNLIRAMEMVDCTTLESSLTGEIIEIDELKRVNGILTGISIIDTMY